MENLRELVGEIENQDEVELRGRVLRVASDAPDPGPPYPHQIEALRRIELGAEKVPPVSGIIHYPTGAGKTRVAMELIARTLRANPRHRFLWATHTKNLIRQSMVRLAELSKLFPRETTFVWAKSADELEEPAKDADVVFLTRNGLTSALERAGDRRCAHPWRQRLERAEPMTLIYDECHQLGADKLQGAWRKFYNSAISPTRGATRPWRTIGLSATPVPTQHEAQRLLEECIFPRRSEGPSTNHDWPFHVIHRVRNETLIDSGVLCELNLYLDRRGDFDVPADLLRKIIGDTHVRAPGEGADKTVLQKYALQFNARVMADVRILEFFAQKLGKSLRLLGKTLVFVPTIEAANRLVGLLYDHFPELRGRVAAVHSKMEQLRVPGQGDASVHEVLGRFRTLGDTPSILVNVDMLTEGFDDPRIRSVVLARLTLSTNRYWQMIGRGTRGPAARGTIDCNVIDPVKLTRLYDYFAGYQPSFAGENRLVEFEDLEEPGPGQGPLPPEVPCIERPPEPASGAYKVDPELERLHGRVAIALRHFLAGNSISEVQAIEAAQNVRIEVSDGQAMLRPAEGRFDSVTATALLIGEISNLESRASVDLAWFRRQLPLTIDEPLLKQRLRTLRAIEHLRLWTESAFAQALTDGAFLASLQQEAAGTASPIPATDRSTTPVAFEPAEEAALDGICAVAWADGGFSQAETSVVLETLRRMFGRAATPALEEAIRARPAPSYIPFDRLERSLTPAQQQLLLLQMAEVAAVDGTISVGERTMLDAVATRLQVPVAFVDAVLGGHLARADVKRSGFSFNAAGSTCPCCAFDLPADAAFCPSCGAAVRT